MLEQWLTEKLTARKEIDLYRSLPPERELLDFTSNDYLGLARSEELYNTIREATGRTKRNGSTGSRLLSGNSFAVDALEQKLAATFRSKAALLFNSGYSANLAVLSAIPLKDDTIIYDELAHASIKDGARLSLAKKFSFRHNDLADLERKIQRATGRIYVAVESIYSMDGDECPLAELVQLSEQYDFTIVLDEAHTTGVRGPSGAGVAVEKNLQEKIGIRLYTFGKAMGVCGACVAGSENLIHYLINYARPFVYTTAPSPYTVASIACAFDYLAANMDLQQELAKKVDLFISHARQFGNRTESRSAIQTFLIPGNSAIRSAAKQLQEQGFDVRPILSPTVPRGTERLRICLHTFNNDDDIVMLVDNLKHLQQQA